MPPDFLNSREDALLVWTLLVVFYAFFKAPRELSKSLLDVLRAFFTPKLLVLFGSAAAYCATLLFVASKLSVWHEARLKETIYWFVGTGFVLVGNAVEDSPDLVRRILRRAFAVTVVVEFLANVYVFPLAAELVLTLFVGIFVLVNAYAESVRNEQKVAKFSGNVLNVLGWCLLVYIALHAAIDPHGFFTSENAERLLVVPALCVAFTPFLYAVASYSQWERRQWALRWARPRP